MSNSDTNERPGKQTGRRAAIKIAVALCAALMLMIGAFVWLVVQFDPLTDDFIDGGEPTLTETFPFDEQ